MKRDSSGKSQYYDLNWLLRETPRATLETMLHGIAQTLWKDGQYFVSVRPSHLAA
ncbi:MAG: hypothetical protein FD180_230 [Planctomycetota bacterium]|nr:MAG: hypothetical protein FD180_230 [Planctomycetota bacterium]